MIKKILAPKSLIFIGCILIIALLIALRATPAPTTKTPTPTSQPSPSPIPTLPSQHYSFPDTPTIKYDGPAYQPPQTVNQYALETRQLSNDEIKQITSTLRFSGEGKPQTYAGKTIFSWENNPHYLDFDPQKNTFSIGHSSPNPPSLNNADWQKADATSKQLIQKLSLFVGYSVSSLPPKYLFGEGVNIISNTNKEANIAQYDFQHSLESTPIYWNPLNPSSTSLTMDKNGTIISAYISIPPKVAQKTSLAPLPLKDVPEKIINKQAILSEATTFNGVESTLEPSIDSLVVHSIDNVLVYDHRNSLLVPAYRLKGTGIMHSTGQSFSFTYLVPTN